MIWKTEKVVNIAPHWLELNYSLFHNDCRAVAELPSAIRSEPGWVLCPTPPPAKGPTLQPSQVQGLSLGLAATAARCRTKEAAMACLPTPTGALAAVRLSSPLTVTPACWSGPPHAHHPWRASTRTPGTWPPPSQCPPLQILLTASTLAPPAGSLPGVTLSCQRSSTCCSTTSPPCRLMLLPTYSTCVTETTW